MMYILTILNGATVSKFAKNVENGYHFPKFGYAFAQPGLGRNRLGSAVWLCDATGNPVPRTAGLT